MPTKNDYNYNIIEELSDPKKICIKFFPIAFFDKKITTSRNTRKIKSISIKINFPKDTNRKRRGWKFNSYDCGQLNCGLAIRSFWREQYYHFKNIFFTNA
jgi:hypothetical protein